MFGRAFRNGTIANRKLLQVVLSKNYPKCSCYSVSASSAVVCSSHGASTVFARSSISQSNLQGVGRCRRIHCGWQLRAEAVIGKVPAFAESVTEGDIRWEKAVGDSVEEDELVAEIETDKTSVQVHAPCSGTITELLVEDGEKVVAHQDVFKLDPSAAGKKAESPKKSEEPAAAAPPAEKKAPEQPKEEKLVSAQAPTKPQPLPQSQQQQQQQQTPSVEFGQQRAERRVKMSRMRLRIAERLKEAQNTCAMLTTFNEIDMSGVFEMRSRYQQQFEKQHGVKLGFMSPFVKAAAYALQQQAAVNAVIDGTDIVYRDYVDISVAVATPKGLVVPVLRGVESKNLAQIEQSIGELGAKARNNQLAVEDMDGGTFTISNGGVFGSLFGTPIINPPQSAILGMHGVFERPVAVKGQVVVKPMMYVALTYDHRLVDGREAVTFLRKIKAFVEDPRVLLLGL